MVANSRAKMNNFLMGVSSLVEKERCMSMLHNDVDISRLMLYAKEIEESKLREISREGKMPRSDEPIQTKYKKRFYHQESSMGTRIGFPTKIPK